MPRACTVCSADGRDSIDRALVAGVSMHQIALRHGVSEWAVSRHRDNHLSPALARVEAQRGGRLLNRVEHLITRTEAILTTAEESGRVSVALQAVRELRELLRLMGTASGELDERPQVTVNLMASPEWLAVRAAILAALAEHPEARASVAARLAALAGADGVRVRDAPSEPVAMALRGPEVDR